MDKIGAEGKLDAIISRMIETIGVTDIEARLLIPAKLQKAKNEGFNEGYTARDKELQPLMRQMEHEKELLKNERMMHERHILSLTKQLAAKDQDLVRLKSEKDKLKVGKEQLQLHRR